MSPINPSQIHNVHKQFLAIMPILASDSLLRENKKSNNKMLPQVGIEPLA